MLGANITLTHQVAMERHHEFIAEARRQHEIDSAFGRYDYRPAARLSEARTAIATALLRVATWLMPEDGRERPATGGLELRPGR